MFRAVVVRESVLELWVGPTRMAAMPDRKAARRLMPRSINTVAGPCVYDAVVFRAGEAGRQAGYESLKSAAWLGDDAGTDMKAGRPQRTSYSSRVAREACRSVALKPRQWKLEDQEPSARTLEPRAATLSL